ARIGREMRNTDELEVGCQHAERVIPREIDAGDVPFDRRVVDRSAKTQPPVVRRQAQQMANDLRAVRSAQLLHYDSRRVIHRRPHPMRVKAPRRRRVVSAFPTDRSTRVAATIRSAISSARARWARAVRRSYAGIWIASSLAERSLAGALFNSLLVAKVLSRKSSFGLPLRLTYCFLVALQQPIICSDEAYKR